MNNKKIKVAIYCRVGNSEQLETNRQEQILREYCKKKNYDIYKVYNDNGYSAICKNRPDYNSLLKDLSKKEFNLLVSYSLNKLTRSLYDFYTLNNLLQKYNCELETLINGKNLPIYNKAYPPMKHFRGGKI